MKIAWVTKENFLDVDYQIVPLVSRNYPTTWFVIHSFGGNCDYSFQRLETSENLEIIQMFLSGRARSVRTLAAYIKIVWNLIKGRYDVIYVNDHGFPYFSFLLYFFGLNSRVVFAIHDVLLHSGFRNGNLIQKYFDWIIRTFEHIHVFSLSQKKKLDEKVSEKSTLVTSLCYKDYGDSSATRGHGIVNFLFFGMIRKNKRLDLLIAAAKILQVNYRGKFSITIAGACDASEQEYKKQLEGLDNVSTKFRFIRNSEIADLFSASHYLVLPYSDVTQSGPLFVAFRYGVPVICSNLEGFHEFVENSNNGIFFEPESVDSLALAMEKAILGGDMLCDRMRDSMLWLGEKCYSPNVLTDRYIDFFHALVSANGR